MSIIDEKIGELRESYDCVLCMDLLYKPMTLICGHSFCKLCIVKDTTNTCPTCRTVYIRPTDYNKAMNHTAMLLFPEEYIERSREILGDIETEKEKEKLYSSIYREVAERARNDYKTSPPPTFDRLIEAADSLRKDPKLIFDPIIIYNRIIMGCSVFMALMIAIEATDVAVGICLCLLFISYLVNRFVPVIIRWIQYGEGVFRNSGGNDRGGIPESLANLLANTRIIAAGPMPQTRNVTQMMPPYENMQIHRHSIPDLEED